MKINKLLIIVCAVILWGCGASSSSNTEQTVSKENSDEIFNNAPVVAEQSVTGIPSVNPLGIIVDDVTNIGVDILGSTLYKDFTEFLVVYNNFDLEGSILKQDQANDEKVYIISVVSLSADTLIYANSLNLNAVPVARSMFNFNRQISPKEIRNLTNYLGVEIVVYKAFFNPEEGNYTYDMVFLQSKDGNVGLFNIFTTANSSAQIIIPDNIKWRNALTLQTTSNKLTKQERFDLYDDLTADTIIKVEGYWQDILTGEIVQIVKSNNDRELSKETYYAYLIKNSKLERKKLLVNKFLIWEQANLRFKFAIRAIKDGYFINDEKMILQSTITFNEAKRSIIVALPNRQTKYYVPYIDGVPNAVKKYLYEDLMNTIKPANFSFRPLNRYDSNLSHSNSISDIIVSYPFLFGFTIIFSIIAGLPIIVS